MEQVIIRWKLNRVVLASKMQMPKGTFNQKVLGNHNSFTKEERLKLRNVLIELLTELDRATDIDFNDALKTILEVEV
jgi:lipopolysaccharide biosynthesis glycosyltransferase